MTKAAPSTRLIGELTFAEISDRVTAGSMLCLPIGAIEQHGRHLPLNTDVVIAEAVTQRLVARFAGEFDLWQLPTVSISLSREHEWAAGTMSLSIQAFTAYMRDLGQAIVRALPARNLVIVNGHGGNRGILQNLIYELEGEFGLNTCVLHPLAMACVHQYGGSQDIHAAKDETSLMLAVAPHLVRQDRILAVQPDAAAVRQLILDQGVTWAWSSGDGRIAREGVSGDPSGASAEFGEGILERILGEAKPALERLRSNRARARR
jgi:creatinine amidohydrolase/Fe(II)-dependent formamide hydrolase-like protein